MKSRETQKRKMVSEAARKQEKGTSSQKGMERMQTEHAERNLREMILEGTLSVFRRKGMKFTMSDIAGELSISKKTIYTVFEDKESLFLAMVDYLFDRIKESEREVLKDESLSTQEKLRRILTVLPESYRELDFRQLYMLREKYPTIYARVEERLETGWEPTIALLQKGMEEKVVREFSIPIFKLMLEAALEQFFQRDILLQNGISYADALEEVVGILMDGIGNTREEKL